MTKPKTRKSDEIEEICHLRSGMTSLKNRRALGLKLGNFCAFWACAAAWKSMTRVAIHLRRHGYSTATDWLVFGDVR